jgi:hypothetical protein
VIAGWMVKTPPLKNDFLNKNYTSEKNENRP